MGHTSAREDGDTMTPGGARIGAVGDGEMAPRSMTTIEFAATQGARDTLARIEAQRAERENRALRVAQEAEREATRIQNAAYRRKLADAARARADAKIPGRAERREARERFAAYHEAKRSAKQAAIDARQAASIAREDAKRARALAKRQKAKGEA